MKIAVITGASSGIGREFVTQLDASEAFDELWVIARRRERLEELASTVRAKIRVIALDLTDKTAVDAYAAQLAEHKPEIAVLVNAGGFGQFTAVADTSLDTLYGMIDLNARALVGMTYVSLPYMKAGSRVYQMGSLSSFQPVPYIGVYGATKAFVLSFSRALNVELKSRGIRVMAVCPGWVRTEFLNRAAEEPDVLRHYGCFYMAPDVVARAMRDMEKKKEVSAYGVQTRTLILLSKILPHRWVTKIWMRLQKKK